MSLWKKQTPPTPRRNLPEAPVAYPSGTVVYTSLGHYLINKDGKKYRITSRAVLDSWSFPLVLETTEAAIAKYPLAVTKLGFRDGTLLTNIADGRMYVVSEGTLRHVTSPAVLDRLNVTNSDFKVVSDAEINLMRLGEEIY